MTFLLICGALVAALALFFKVESIEITGTSRYSTDEVERASGVHVGDNLYLMDKNAVASRITQQLPYVETVQISRRLPKTLCISVTECRGLAAIEQDGGSGSSARAASSSIPRPRTTRRSTPSLPG